MDFISIESNLLETKKARARGLLQKQTNTAVSVGLFLDSWEKRFGLDNAGPCHERSPGKTVLCGRLFTTKVAKGLGGRSRHERREKKINDTLGLQQKVHDRG